MFISIRGRVLINVEALNMTESVGNYVKHRRVPVLLPSTYTTYFVPAISGESIAHGYQEVLAGEAKKNNIPVCKLCERGIFLKSTNESVFNGAFGKKPPKDEFEFEKEVVSNCIVEDVGGFLYAPRAGGNVKRTSNFYTGYMIPVKEILESIVIEPQLHSRYALGTPYVAKGAIGQMIYYVELSSAVYTFSFDLDTRFIGRATFVYGKVGESLVNNIDERILVTLDSVKKFLTEMMFGAKKTRFLPVVDWESLVVAVADDVWTIPSPNSVKYMDNARRKAEKVGDNLKLFFYINPDIFKGTSEYVKRKTEELINTLKQVIDEWRRNIQEKMPEYASKIDWDSIVKSKLESLISKRLDEVTESEDLRYITNVSDVYSKVKENLGRELYEDFTTCLVDAINEAKSRVGR